jgi:hypothetical protein
MQKEPFADATFPPPPPPAKFSALRHNFLKHFSHLEEQKC